MYEYDYELVYNLSILAEKLKYTTSLFKYFCCNPGFIDKVVLTMQKFNFLVSLPSVHQPNIMGFDRCTITRAKGFLQMFL